MTARYIYQRGKKRRKMHLAAFDRLGNVHGALCGIGLDFNTSINVPLGKGVCRRCIAVENRLLSPHPDPSAHQNRRGL